VVVLYGRALSLLVSDADQLAVEFFVPYEFLAEPVHSWQIPLDSRHKRFDRLGRRLVVVVRSWERGLSSDRFIKPARSLWRRKWHLLQDLANLESSPIFKPQTDAVFRDLYSQLQDEEILCYAETLAPPQDIDACD